MRDWNNKVFDTLRMEILRYLPLELGIIEYRKSAFASWDRKLLVAEEGTMYTSSLLAKVIILDRHFRISRVV